MHTFVLGGGGGPRDLGVPLTTDMEQIDPDAVALPQLVLDRIPAAPATSRSSSSPARAREPAMSRITNRRWALSAFGTASSAALSAADTVYSVTPLYHPSGLMMSIGGAIAGGARLAMATTFEPVDVLGRGPSLRRDGRLLHVDPAARSGRGAAEPGERHHPLRLFIGSGMPRGLWRRVQERFKPARVLEFYASTEAGAILVNLRGTKPGSLGRPLPGSAEVRIAAYDIDGGRLVLGPDGFAKRCGPDEVGMLLARVSPTDITSTTPLRGVFSRNDAWLATGDLFRVDADGDYWRVDNVNDVIRTAEGPVFTGPIRDALGDLPAVDLAVAYGVPADSSAGADQVAIAAVTVRPEYELESVEVGHALTVLPPKERPAIVLVVDQIPVTTWFRPLTSPLRAAGIPTPGPGKQIWYRSPDGDRYRPLTAVEHERLAGTLA